MGTKKTYKCMQINISVEQKYIGVQIEYEVFTIYHITVRLKYRFFASLRMTLNINQ